MADLTLTSFNAGDTVELHRRTGDFYAPGDSAKTAKVDDNSVVSFKGVDVGTYWAVGRKENVPRSVTAKDLPGVSAAVAPGLVPGRQDGDRQVAELTPSQAVARPSREIHTGARGTRQGEDRVRGHERPPTDTSVQQTPEGQPDQGDPTTGRKEPEPQPRPRAEDAPKGQQQRSATFTGEATPKDEPEAQPRPTQDTVSKRQTQRSDTEQGEATPKDVREEQPFARQEDVPKGMKQRSATESGSAEPKSIDKGIEQRERHDSSEDTAAGNDPQKTAEQNRPSKSDDRVKINPKADTKKKDEE